jgi:glucose-1-phosphate thymidylyltransferase
MALSTARALVLARGLGTRMRQGDTTAALTPDQQRAAEAGLKALMPIAGRPFLDYVLSALADAGVSRVGVVVAPDHGPAAARYTAHPPSRVALEFVVQPEPRGTADAVLAAEAWSGGEPFLVANGDNLYPAAVLRDLISLGEPGLPVFDAADLVRTGNIPADRIRAFALVAVDESGYLSRIVEKPAVPLPPEPADAIGTVADPILDAGGVSMNLWRFDRRIFAACRDVDRSPRGEFELPEAVALAMRRGVRFRALPARGPVLDLSRRADARDVEHRLAGAVPRP